MHIHRTEQAGNFTVLPNSLLQNRQLSYNARGLLVDLLSRVDGWREDGRQMADTSPQGRAAVRKMLRELAAAGYYRVEKVRMSDGTIRTETHVYDTPFPGVTRPASGGSPPSGAGALIKNPEKEPTLPPVLDEPPPEAPVSESDERLREAVATLFRVIRPEPRLRLGEAEAAELAPLVAQWLERGSTPADLARALLPGLPVPVHSAVAVLRYRLRHKLPPVPEPERPATPRYAECARCHDPVPRPGICAPCAGLGSRAAPVGSATVARAGAARVREAMLAARSALRMGPAATALSPRRS